MIARSLRATARSVLWLWMALMISSPAWAQEPGSSEPEEEETREATEGEESTEETTDDEDVSRSKEVVVTATRYPSSPDRLSYRVTERSNDWINTRKLARSLPESLTEETGILVQKTGPGQISPFIRGLTGFHTLTMIDGIRLNNASFRPGPNQYLATIDSFSIDRFEVVRGPASVLWGSDAVGGTLQAIVKERRSFEEGTHINGRIFERYASAEQSFTTRVETQGNFDDSIGFHLGITHRSFGSVDGGQHVGEIPNTGYEEWAGDTKWRFKVTDRLDWTVAYQQMTQSDVPRTHSTFQAVSWRGTATGSDLRRDFDQNRQLAYTQLEYESDGDDWLDRATFSLSWHRQSEVERREQFDASAFEFSLRRQGFTDDTLGAFLQLESDIGDAGRLIYGGEYYHDTVSSFRRDFDSTGSQTVRPRGPLADDAEYALTGVYVQHETEIADGVHTMAGLRYTFARATADQVDPNPSDAVPLPSVSENFDQVVWNARVLFDATDWLRPYAGVSTAFRAPNLQDLTRFDSARSGEFEVGSSNLDPERFTAYEVGAHVERDNVSGNVTYFYTDVNNLIARFPTGTMTPGGDPIVTLANSGDGYIHGVEAAAEVRFAKEWRVFGNFTWLEGYIEVLNAFDVEEDDPISRLFPAAGLVGVGWEEEDGSKYVEALAQFAGDADRLSLRDKGDTQRIPPGGTPGYTVFTLRGGVRVSQNIALFGAIENLTNHDYRIHGSGLNQPGTNVILGVDLTF
ncbi:MAG: TonB-dependent receptor [Planctomycetota bacterium]